MSALIDARFALWGNWGEIVDRGPTEQRLRAFFRSLHDYAENVNPYLGERGRTNLERALVAFELAMLLTFIEKSPSDDSLTGPQSLLELALRKAVPTLRVH